MQKDNIRGASTNGSTSDPDMPSSVNVFDNVVTEGAALEKLGYQQELKRSFGLLGMIGFSFNIVASWSSLSGVLIVGVESGGPPVMIWGWLGVCIVTLAVAYSMAEMCSAYPVAGGQYSWVAILAPPSYARGLSYVCGWFMIIGIIAMGATNNFIAANFILGMANLANPAYVIERWHTTLLSYLVCFMTTSLNLWGPQLLDKISRGMLVWNIVAFIVVIVTILAVNDHKRDASFVFSEFQNFTGFDTGTAAMIGLLQTFFGMCCYDAPAHMTEEMRNARKGAPQAILMSVYLGAVTGFIFLIAVCFCIGDINNTALSNTGVPIIQIFSDSTNSVIGSCVLTTMILVITLVAANGLLAEGSRSIYAFSRDHGLPFSHVFSKVSTKHQIPIPAILLTAAVQISLNSIYFGSYTGFLTVISIATEGFYVSYALPLLARLLGHFSSHASVATTLAGPYSLGRWGVPLNAIGLVFLIFAIITFNFPSVYPVNSQNMNYTSAAIGLTMLLALVTWLWTGRKNFTGPNMGRLAGMSEGTEMFGNGFAQDRKIAMGKSESESEAEGKRY